MSYAPGTRAATRAEHRLMCAMAHIDEAHKEIFEAYRRSALAREKMRRANLILSTIAGSVEEK